MTQGANAGFEKSTGDWEGQIVCSACGEEFSEVVKEKRIQGGVCPFCGDVGKWGRDSYRIKARRQVFTRMGPRCDWQQTWEYKDQIKLTGSD